MSDSDGYASPACSLHEADDGYLGYFTAGEIVPRLMELQSAAQALAAGPDEGVRTRAVRWSALLAAHLTRLNAAPSPPAPDATAARAQMARVLAELTPKVRDDTLHADLTAIAGELAAA